MNSNIRKILKLTIGLVLYGFLYGCEIIATTVFQGILSETARPDPEPWMTGKNRYEPIILASNEDMIQIKYLSVGPNAEHEQVKQLMSGHCHGAYVETSRVELRGYDTVEAECTHGTESLQ